MIIGLNKIKLSKLFVNSKTRGLNLLKGFNGFNGIINNKTFCSKESNNSSNKLNLVKEKVFKLSLLNVNKYGWSEESIKHASNELGYSNV